MPRRAQLQRPRRPRRLLGLRPLRDLDARQRPRTLRERRRVRRGQERLVAADPEQRRAAERGRGPKHDSL